MTEDHKYPLLTLEEARILLKQVVDTVPEDFRYMVGRYDSSDIRAKCDVSSAGGLVTCYYKPRPDIFPADDARSQTGCIVGRVMALAGREITPEQEGLRVNDASLFMPWNLSATTVDYLYEAQIRQDAYGTWHEAYAIAEAAYEQALKVRDQRQRMAEQATEAKA